MNIYIAAPSEERQAAREMKIRLKAAGYTMTSRWIESEFFNSTDEGYLIKWAENDLQDVYDADLLVAINSEEYRNSGTGGRHVELGYALAYAKPVILCGIKSNIFHYHSNIRKTFFQLLRNGHPVSERFETIFRRAISCINSILWRGNSAIIEPCRNCLIDINGDLFV